MGLGYVKSFRWCLAHGHSHEGIHYCCSVVIFTFTIVSHHRLYLELEERWGWRYKLRIQEIGFKATEIRKRQRRWARKEEHHMAREVGGKSMRSRKPREQGEGEKRGGVFFPSSLIKV